MISRLQGLALLHGLAELSWRHGVEGPEPGPHDLALCEPQALTQTPCLERFDELVILDPSPHPHLRGGGPARGHRSFVRLANNGSTRLSNRSSTPRTRGRRSVIVPELIANRLGRVQMM